MDAELWQLLARFCRRWSHRRGFIHHWRLPCLALTKHIFRVLHEGITLHLILTSLLYATCLYHR
jgi:hypothetical protein